MAGHVSGATLRDRSPVGPVGWRTVSEDNGRLQCPFCEAYEVERLYLASLKLDSCECRACNARWDEDSSTGAYRGRGSSTSQVTPRDY